MSCRLERTGGSWITDTKRARRPGALCWHNAEIGKRTGILKRQSRKALFIRKI
jgi:hypothetical protein